jgi:hypothetical protein
MRVPLAVPTTAAAMAFAFGLLLSTAAFAQGGGESIKFIFTPQAGLHSACMTCGWHSACVEPYPWGPALDFGGSCSDSESIYFRNFAFLPPGSANTYVGYAAAYEIAGTLCKTVDVRIWDTQGGDPLGRMSYVHTYRVDSGATWLYASEDGYDNEYIPAHMAKEPWDEDIPESQRENWDCYNQGYWTGVHLHERHYDGTSTFFLRNEGDCGATCDERYPCAPSPANCLYDPQNWWDNWVRAFCIDDTDCDGWTDDEEDYLGTDPLDDCPDHSSHDAWPLDMDMNTLINLAGDVSHYTDNIGKSVGGDPSLRRLDLNADGVINLTGDVIKYAGMIGAVCTNP